MQIIKAVLSSTFDRTRSGRPGVWGLPQQAHRKRQKDIPMTCLPVPNGPRRARAALTICPLSRRCCRFAPSVASRRMRTQQRGWARRSDAKKHHVPNLAHGRKAISDGAEFCTISTATHPPNNANLHGPARDCPPAKFGRGQIAASI